jgi:outer membrane protein TolC
VRYLSRGEALALAVERARVAPTKGLSRLERDCELNRKLFDVEIAYWRLYASHWMLASREQGIHLACQTARVVAPRYHAGQASRADYLQCRGQYELFRGQRLQSLAAVEEAEQRLCRLLGLPFTEDSRLTPSSVPALGARPLAPATEGPEVALARRRVASARLLAGGGEREREGMFFARILLESSLAALAEAERQGHQTLDDSSRRIARFRRRVRQTRAQGEAFGEQLRSRRREYLAGRCTLDVLLEAQRFFADALAAESEARAEHAVARCTFAYAGGVLLQERRRLGTARAERERTRGQARRQRKPPPDALFFPHESPADGYSLPGLWKSLPPLRQVEPWPAAGGQVPAPR